MRQAEKDHLELQDAQRHAEEARRLAEEAAFLEKTEREAKVCCVSYTSTVNAHFRPSS